MFWVRSGPGDLSFITWSAEPGDHCGQPLLRRAYEEIGGRLESDALAILHERVFGEVGCADTISRSRRVALGDGLGAIPPTHIEGVPKSKNYFYIGGIRHQRN